MKARGCNSPSVSFRRSCKKRTPVSETKSLPVPAHPRSPFADWRQYVTYLGFVLIFVFFSATLYNKGFLEPTNLLNILRQTAMISIMSVAMTYVLSAGEIDLSIGMVAGLASLVVAVAMDRFGVVAGVIAGLAVGGLVGLVNGVLTTRIGIPSFLATLAMMGIARGSAMWMTQTKSVPILDDDFIAVFGGGNLGPIPVLVLWTLAFAIVGHVILRRTTFGRRVLATGGSETAARYSGVDTKSIKLRVLVISSVAAAFAGMLYAGRLHSGRFQLGEGDELSVIAAAVLGGTSLFGGVGTVVGSIVGSLMIGVINNGLLLMGLEYSQQLIARGVIIIVAVAISQSRK
jgi:ribose transport system permease protein